ncbi:MAG: hypothetical protein ACYSVY_12235 [Planctomycetota bacterium]|jgi:hypothetical protein
MKYILVIALAVAALALVWWLRSKRAPMPAAPQDPEEVERQILTEFAQQIDAQTVPEHLRDLVPLAEKWGIGDDVARGDLMRVTTEEEKRRFQEALRGRTAQVTAWLDSFTDGAMPEAAVPFMYMLEALDESGLWPD